MGRVRSLRVRNYRSVGPWVEVNFPTDGPVVLVGANNAGKSNIVRALELVLGEGWPGSHQPDDHEYFERDPDNAPIHVVVRVDGVTGEGRSGPFDVAEFVWRVPPDDPEDTRPVEFNMIEPDGFARWANNHAREQCFCMLVGADRRLNYQLSYTSKWTLLSKLMRQFHAHLKQDDERVDRLRGLFDDIVATFYEVEPFSQFADDLRRRAAEFGSNLEYGLELDFSAYDPSNFFHSIRVRPHVGSEVRTFDELGTGQEQILAIAFACAYAQAFGNEAAEGLVLVVEEPEAHLHPMAQKWLGRKIHELAAQGVQVVVTTHSPAFVDLEHADGLHLLRKPDEQQATSIIKRSATDLADFCNAHGAGGKATAANVLPFYKASATDDIVAGMFARACVLVEGPTEQLALPELLGKVDLDLLARGIAVVPVGGIGSIARWWRFYSAYEVPVFALFDRDSRDDKDGAHQSELLATMSLGMDEQSRELEGSDPLTLHDRWGVFAPDFEKAMRTLFPSQYVDLESECAETIGSTKPLKARFACSRLDVAADPAGWTAIRSLAEFLGALS